MLGCYKKHREDIVKIIKNRQKRKMGIIYVKILLI